MNSEQADPWQKKALYQIITAAENVALNCTRGAGKSYTAAAACYLEAALFGHLAVCFSRSDRQAKEEVFDKVIEYHRHWQLEKHWKQTTHDLRLANGGRVLSLPCSEATVVGKHKVALLIVDEAAKVPDGFFPRVTPMTAIGEGRLGLLSSPFGKRGYFYRVWSGQSKGRDWKRFRASWKDCPRITVEHIEKERGEHGDWWVRQEYLDCAPGEEFVDVTNSYFAGIDFEGLIDQTMQPLEGW